MMRGFWIHVCGESEWELVPWQTWSVAEPGFRRRWWRQPWLDEVRRRLSYLVYVQFPQDLVPVAPQVALQPPLEDKHVSVLLQALTHALKADVGEVSARLVNEVDRDFVMMWPGEHYRLLAGIVSTLKPRLAVEVGTWQGAAAAILSKGSERVVTFDVVPVDQIPGAIPDLLNHYPNIVQSIGDLSRDEIWLAQRKVFADSDLVFVDGPKDGAFEPVVVPRILEVMKPGTLMILDDIRFAGMQDLWRQGIQYPRIDLGSFGHFSGTGVVFR